SAAKADWAPLAGRAVIIWPDADTAGLDYARAVAKAATQVGAMSVVITSPPANVKVGWDAADAESEGWNEARTAALLAAAVPFKSETAPRGGLQAGGGTASGGRRRPPPQRDELMQCIELVEYWHDPGRMAYASIPIAEHVEHWPIQ